MARKRMFSRDIVDSDAYSNMSLSSQVLYFRMVMCADDDGVVDSALMLMRQFGFCEDELSELCRLGFVIRLTDGIYLIRHWQAHNKIPSNIYKPSRYSHILKAFKVNGMGVYESRADGGEVIENKDEEKLFGGLISKADFEDGLFEIKVAEYFIRQSYVSSADSFIAYNAARGWVGVGGESVKENFERYADEWEKSYCLKHNLPIA